MWEVGWRLSFRLVWIFMAWETYAPEPDWVPVLVDGLEITAELFASCHSLVSFLGLEGL